MNLRPLALAAAGLLSPALAFAQPGDVPRGKLPQGIAPVDYDIHITMDPADDGFSGEVSIDVMFDAPTSAFYMHGNNLEVSETILTLPDGTEIGATYEQVDPSGVVLITPAQEIPAGTASIAFDYTGVYDSSLDGLYKVVRDGEPYLMTQFEAIAARKAFPSFDEPRFKVPYDVTLTTPADSAVSTTMSEVSTTTGENGMVTRVFETTPPLPTYLLAFIVGPYDVVDGAPLPPTELRENEVPFRALSPKGQGELLTYAMDNTPGIVEALEDYFGIALRYPKLDIIAAPDFSAGAMENVGAITYLDFLLLLDENAPLQQKRLYTEVHAHELAHQWFGNLVTPVWWDDIWLNEAFATWMSYKAAQQHWPEGAFDREVLQGALGAMNVDSLVSTRQIREPVPTNDQIDEAFDGITYQKGGGVLSMIEAYIGEDRFQDGVQLHMKRHYDGVATVDDFMQSLADGSGEKDIIPAFRSFIDQPGVPLVTADLTCRGKRATVTVNQSRYAPLGSEIDTAKTWSIPMCIAHGDDKTCQIVSKKKQKIRLDTDSCPEFIHPNADGGGYYRFTFATPEAWAGLSEAATDLSAKEALVSADSLAAAFDADAISAEAYLDGLFALGEHEAFDVVRSVLNEIETKVTLLDSVDPAAADTLRQQATDAFAGRYNSLGEDSSEAVLLKSALGRFLAVVTEADDFRQPMVEDARAIIGFETERNPAAVAPDLYETVLSVGVQELGQPYFDALLDIAQETENPALRTAAFGALARTEDPTLSGRLVDLAYTADLSSRPKAQIIFRQLARDATQDIVWTRAQEDFDAFLNLFPVPWQSQQVPTLAGTFCDVDKAQRFADLMEERADRLSGYERPMAQGLESATLCATLKDQRGEELAQAVIARSE